SSGTTRRGLASPKGGAIFGPWRNSELYVNAGMGYHSNDARGSVMTRDPSITPLVRAEGAEVGFRSIAIPHVQTTLAVWRLDLGSELLFVGDAGTTKPSRSSERYGVEWTTYARLSPMLTADADIAW